MTPMSAPVYSVPENPQQEIVDFLRRLSSMLTGGRNAEMLLQAATAIETLGRRAASAERLFQEQQEDHARNLELREVAELASDNLMSEVESLKAEIDLLKAQLEEREQQLEQSQSQHEIDRNQFAEEALRLQAMAEISEARLAEAHAEIEELRRPPPVATFDDSIAVVPVQSLQLARTQFDYLAKGFADNGDIISLTIAEIGARAIDKALADNEPAGDAGVT
jgi:predicted RNase H-like nuclease (RuvC/YqgF family)